MKKALMSLAIVMALLANSAAVYASITPIAPLWSNTSSISTSLNFSGTTAHCKTTIIGMSGTTHIHGTLSLQRKVGSSWVTEQHWNASAINSSVLTISETKSSCVSKSTYKIVVNATVYRNGTWEVVTIDGVERTCP